MSTKRLSLIITLMLVMTGLRAQEKWLGGKSRAGFKAHMFDRKKVKYHFDDLFKCKDSYYATLTRTTKYIGRRLKSESHPEGGYFIQLDSAFNVRAKVYLPSTYAGHPIRHESIIQKGGDTFIYIFSKVNNKTHKKYYFYRQIVKMQLSKEIYLLDQFDFVERRLQEFYRIVPNSDRTRFALQYLYYDRKENRPFVGVTFYDKDLIPQKVSDDLIAADSLKNPWNFFYNDAGNLFCVEYELLDKGINHKISNIIFVSPDTTLYYSDTDLGLGKYDHFNFDVAGNLHILSADESENMTSYHSLRRSRISGLNGQADRFAPCEAMPSMEMMKARFSIDAVLDRLKKRNDSLSNSGIDSATRADSALLKVRIQQLEELHRIKTTNDDVRKWLGDYGKYVPQLADKRSGFIRDVDEPLKSNYKRVYFVPGNGNKAYLIEQHINKESRMGIFPEPTYVYSYVYGPCYVYFLDSNRVERKVYAVDMRETYANYNPVGTAIIMKSLHGLAIMNVNNLFTLLEIGNGYILEQYTTNLAGRPNNSAFILSHYGLVMVDEHGPRLRFSGYYFR